MSNEDYRKLSKSEILGLLRNLKKWRLSKGKLHREYKFRSFEDAMSFMMRSAHDVTELEHHPEWFNVYDRVVVDLVTHDVHGISNYDFILAERLERVASLFQAL